MRRFKKQLIATWMAAPLFMAAPTVLAQDKSPATLNDDQQKMLDLINKGMDLERSGDIAAAQKIYERWIALSAKEYGDDSPMTGLGYRLMAGSMESQGRWTSAEPIRRRLYDQNLAQVGEQHEETLIAAGFLAANYVAQGRSSDALPLRQHIWRARVALLGENDPKTIIAASNVAASLSAVGKLAESETLYRNVLDKNLAVHGRHHLETANAYGNMAVILRARGQYQAAAPMLAEALTIDQSLSRGPNDRVALRLYNSAINYADMGQQQPAMDQAEQALAMWQASSGPDSADAALGHAAMGYILSRAGRFDEAEAAYRSALAIREKKLGTAHPLTGEVYNNLALTMENQGRPPSVIEPILRKALDISRAANGEGNEAVAVLYGNIAQNLAAQGRYNEADALYRHALDLRQRLTGSDHPSYATLLINYASVQRNNGDAAAAQALASRAVGIYEKTMGTDHVDTAWAYGALGGELSIAGQHQQAASYMGKALDIRRRVLGEQHMLTATSYHQAASALTRAGQGDATAEPYYRQALAIFQHAVGDQHIDTARAYESLSSNLNRQGRAAEAEQMAGKAMDIYRLLSREAIGRDALGLSALDRRQADPDRGIYTSYMNAAFSLMSHTPDAVGQSRLQDRAFMAAQDAISSASGRAMMQTAARHAAKSPQMAETVRQEQSLATQAQMLDKNLLRALSEGQSVTATKLRGELESVRAQLADVSAQIDRRYPEYRQLVAPRPAGLAEVQKALKPDEALLLMTEAANSVHLFVVTPNVVGWSRPNVELAVMMKDIGDLRCDVDVETCSAARTTELDAMPMSEQELNGHRRFDLATAHRLYQHLFAPIEPLLANSKRIYVNASGKLGDLPLAMLSASPMPAGADVADPDMLARAKWLADRYAFTNLPSVAALTLPRNVRTISTNGAAASHGNNKGSVNFRGYGAPIFQGSEGATRAAVGAGVGVFSSLSRSGAPLADPDALRKLAPLPGTTTELTALAKLLGTSDKNLVLAQQATEQALRSDALLANSRIIAIATHGLLPDPILGLGEPGLVLTPPSNPSDLDDGLLTASEAAQLSLSADWVILSACNTASAHNSGGNDSLSALARGFLFAGAKALLASHWRVSDDATAALTVETLSVQQDQPALSRAQALSTAMAYVRTGQRADGSKLTGWKSDWAHPSAWAAFTNIANFD